MKQTDKKYQCIPFWSWNDELDEQGLVEQVEWMHENGVGGFFMHARGGLKTEYLGKKWFDCIEACSKKAEELGMHAYAYDENGWPSGFVGGKLLENIENHDRYLTHTIGAYDEKALVSYDLSGAGLHRVHEPCENCLNVYEHYSASTADILNPEVVDQFLAMTHEEYKKRDTYSLKGFFTDEPQYYRWDTSYTKVLAPYFKKTYGEDILDGLGLLFVEKEGFRAFRYKYWKAMQSLMLENFGKKIYDWCDGNGYKLTGHYVEETSLDGQMWCCGGCMPFYEYEHIPGMDYLGRNIVNEISPKQLGSVCEQLGKKQAITETYGCCGWDVTPLELKMIAESQYVGGANLMCQHLLPFTEHGQRKRDYPAHYSKVNPWVKKNFKQFNDYFSVLGEILSESREVVSVGVLHPIRSAYLYYKRTIVGGALDELEKAFADLAVTLSHKQIGHHYLDETLLAKYGKVEGTKLILGNCAYEYIVLPKIYAMDKTTNDLLRQFVNAGGRVLLTDEKPQYLEGEPYDFDYLETNVSWEEIEAAQPYSVRGNFGDLRSVMRKDEQGRTLIYLVNLGDETEVEIKTVGAMAYEWYDIFNDTRKIVGEKLRFAKGQSYILYPTNGAAATTQQKKEVRLGKVFDVCGDPDNYLTLDYIRFSTDGKTYSEPWHHMGIFNEMLRRRYEGDLYLKYEFTVDAIPERCVLLAEDTNTLDVSVNGEKVERCGSSDVEKALYKYDVAKYLREGKNEIVVRMHYFQSEQVYYALFGENVTESLKNCLAYDSDIEAVYLKGNFGVYGDFKKGNAENVLLGENFRIGKQKKRISSLIKEGYPFFSGDITLKQTLEIEDTNAELVVDERFQTLEVKVNGKKAKTLLFDYKVDLSDALVAGKNDIELVLTVGNRNLLGPFHTLAQEDLSAVGPHTFERIGTWTEDGKSWALVDHYAFVKTLV